MLSLLRRYVSQATVSQHCLFQFSSPYFPHKTHFSNTGACTRVRRRTHALNLNLRHLRRTTQSQVRLLRLGILGVVVANRRLDRVLRQHAAMQFDGRQAQFLCDLGIADLRGLFERHAAHEFGQVGGRSDGGAAAEGLEFDVADGVVCRVDFDLEFHYVTAGGCADEAWMRKDVLVGRGIR